MTIRSVSDEDDLMIINKSGVTIRVHATDIRQTGRVAQGVKLIDIAKRNDVISNVCVVAREEEEPEGEMNDETNSENTNPAEIAETAPEAEV